MRKLKSTKSRIQSQHSELHEIELLKSWIESQQPERGSNPMSLPALPSDARAGRLDSTRFSRYAGATRFLVGRHHSFSAALLIGGRRGKDVQVEKELVNECNILVCTPGRLLQHMDETPHFDCSQLQVFVLDEVDSMLSDPSFKQTMNAIISELPKQRQTLLFSATHPKDAKDLAVLCLKDPEFLSVHEKSVTATPNKLRQTFVIVPLHQKLDMLWSFIKRNLKSRILVFLSTRKQVQFVCEAFKMLSPTITWMALYGKLDQRRRMATVSEFSNQPSVLFSTDVASRGLDFNQGVDWVVQVDCPGDVASYIHRVGRTARFDSVGKSLLFLMPSEEKMLEKLQAANIPIREIKPNKNVGQSVSGKLANFIVQYPGLLHARAQSALKTYLKSVTKKDKEIFDVTKLPIDEFSASIGLASTPRIRFLSNKIKSSSKKASELSPVVEPELLDKDHELELLPKEELDLGASSDEERDKDPLPTNDTADISPPCTASTRVSKKKKKLKINIHKPVGSRVVFDEEGNTLPPLARLADISNASGLLDQIQDKKNEYYKKLREGLKKVDKDDKVVDGHRRREKRLKDKIRSKRGDTDEEPEEEEEEDVSDSEGEPCADRPHKRPKIYFGSDSDGEIKERKDKPGFVADSISLEEQEAVALKLLSAMHS